MLDGLQLSARRVVSMKRIKSYLPLLMLLAWPALSADVDPAAIEVWLASSEKCNSCEIFAEVAKQRGYRETLTYEHRGRALVIPIKRVRKEALPQKLLDQLKGDAGPAGHYWPIQLTAIVTRGDDVVYASSIGESVELRGITISEERMKPPAHPPKNHPSLRESIDYRGIFVREWNLEYFVAVALGDRKPNANGRFIDLNAARPATLGARNVILWGAGGMPIKNALFISQRMQEARAVLERGLRDASPRFITLYGRGPDGNSNDTSSMHDGVVSFMHPVMPIDYAADIEGLSRVFTALASTQGRHSLLVHVGHNGSTGIPIWGSIGTVAPTDFTALGAPSQLKMISGGCHSGLFARSVQCGFFAAHPEVVATGCQLSPAAIERSDDYLRLFFRQLASGERDGAAVTLDRAHWVASVQLEHHQLSYTTVDALADEYFVASSGALPKRMTVAEIRKLRAVATPPEAEALDALTVKLDSTLEIALDDVVKRNHDAEKMLQGRREDSSAQRNRALALPYRLMLPSLARRLTYRSARSTDPTLQRATQCEAESLATL
jgi:hypothetical protein